MIKNAIELHDGKCRLQNLLSQKIRYLYLLLSSPQHYGSLTKNLLKCTGKNSLS